MLKKKARPSKILFWMNPTSKPTWNSTIGTQKYPKHWYSYPISTPLNTREYKWLSLALLTSISNSLPKHLTGFYGPASLPLGVPMWLLWPMKCEQMSLKANAQFHKVLFSCLVECRGTHWPAGAEQNQWRLPWKDVQTMADFTWARKVVL